jgi:glycosyltransferase involved in cell wall biosynthesis
VLFPVNIQRIKMLNRPTLHVLANPYGITDLRYRMEPFNIAAHKFVTEMCQRGWPVMHYGHELSTVPCENVPVISAKELQATGDGDLFTHDNSKTPNLDLGRAFGERTNRQLKLRCQSGDIVLCFYGTAHQPAVAGIDHVKIVEPSIGYGGESVFAPFRVFTSYAIMHYFYGLRGMLLTPSWFDDVIPNAMSVEEFEYSDSKSDYLLYQGRISPDKGIDLAIQVAERTQHRLIIAGPGTLQSLGYRAIPTHVEMFGYANVEQRKQLLKKARALIAPTHYIEPFGNMVAEALMSGTPVLTSDWGGFVENNMPGITGYRCRDFRDFLRAVANLDKIKHSDCRDWAMSKFSSTVVHDQFDRYLDKLHRMDFYS